MAGCNSNPRRVLKKTERLLNVCIDGTWKYKKESGQTPGQERIGNLARLLNAYTRLLTLCNAEEKGYDPDYGDPDYVESLNHPYFDG